MFRFFFYLNRLSTERKSWFSRRCPDAGVGLGFGVGVFGLSGGGRVLLRSYMEPTINPEGTCKRGADCYPCLVYRLGEEWYDLGLVNGQLNSLCLNDCEIVTGSIEVGGAVFPPLFYCPGMTLNSPPCLVAWFYCFFYSLVFCMTRKLDWWYWSFVWPES